MILLRYLVETCHLVRDRCVPVFLQENSALLERLSKRDHNLSKLAIIYQEKKNFRSMALLRRKLRACAQDLALQGKVYNSSGSSFLSQLPL